MAHNKVDKFKLNSFCKWFQKTVKLAEINAKIIIVSKNTSSTIAWK